MIKTVVFDLGNVLIPFDHKRGYKALAPYCSHSPEEIAKRISSTDLVRRFETGLIEEDDFFEAFSRLLELKVDLPTFRALWSSIFFDETLVPEETVRRLKRRYRLLLLSNTNTTHFAMVRESYPIIHLFDDSILSYEVKAMKPDPKIYRAAIAKAQCAPGEMFFTDDIASNVEAARKEGIDAAQFLSLEQLEEEMRARGIEW